MRKNSQIKFPKSHPQMTSQPYNHKKTHLYIHIQFKKMSLPSASPSPQTLKPPQTEIGSFEKSVISNNKQSIEKHLSHMKIDQNQLNYALFLSIEHFRLEEHTEECVLLLLRHKANPNCELNKDTPLTVACRKGQQLLVKVLLENGAKADLCNKNGEHPLSVILKDKRQNYDVAHTLLAHMASVNIEIGGRYPIVIAVEREFFRIFQMVIEKGANLVFQNQNILHVVVKTKFRKLEKKKKFIKELAGRLFLMQEDSSHKLPTDYEENEQIKAFLHQNFKPKVQKQDSSKQQSNSKATKEKELNKAKDTDALNCIKDGKKKSFGKELDVSFSEVDEEEFQDGVDQGRKLKEVVEIPEEEDRNAKDCQKEVNGKRSSEMNCLKQTQVLNLSQKQKKQKSPEKPVEPQPQTQKQREEQREKIKKKLNSSLTALQKKKPHNNSSSNIQNVVDSSAIGSKKKKQKNQEIIPKTLLKRKNSSIEEENTKLDKNKATTIKKSSGGSGSGNLGKKDAGEGLEKVEKFQQDQKMVGKKVKPGREIQEISFQIEEEKIEKESQTDSEDAYRGPIASLNEQIYELVHSIDLKNQQKIPMVQEIIKLLQDTMRQELVKHRQNVRLELYVYGSQSTGLAIQHSDIDLLVLSEFESGLMMKLLQQHKTLSIPEVKQVKFIPGATVPVIKLQMSDKYDCMQVDLTFHSRNHMGLKCSQMIKSFMLAEPLLRPLVLVIKFLVKAYYIGDPYKGGLSSYAITLMVIALLQFTEKSKKKVENVGELLLNFLYFYGEQIDYISQAIIIHALGLFGEQPVYCIYRLPYITDLNPKLIIYDPLNPVNNVGRTTYKIAAIRKLFSLSYLRLKAEPRCQLRDIFDGSFGELLADF